MRSKVCLMNQTLKDQLDSKSSDLWFAYLLGLPVEVCDFLKDNQIVVLDKPDPRAELILRNSDPFRDIYETKPALDFSRYLLHYPEIEVDRLPTLDKWRPVCYNCKAVSKISFCMCPSCGAPKESRRNNLGKNKMNDFRSLVKICT